MKLGEIAGRLGCKLDGDPGIEITDVAAIEEATTGQLTFLANRRYRAAVKTTRASAILVSPNEVDIPIAALRSSNPYLDFARSIEFFHAAQKYSPGVHRTAVVAPTAKIGPGAYIGPCCFVGEYVEMGRSAVLHSFVSIYRNAKIGNDFFAHSHAVVREGCRVGDRVTLQNGAVIGADGFGFAKQANSRWYKIRQAGLAVIGDDVEVQAGAIVDRATIGETVISRGAKIDNLVQVGHACKVGENTLLCGQVGLAGSTRIGDNCVLAGQVGAAGHLTIGDGAVITSQSGVPNDVPPGAIYSGYPAIENKLWLRSVAVFNQLPELQRQVRELRAEIEELKSRSR
ncbi:MAG TPA: UDP-3-O-(3-hydroxymyristoyl)glucosamine N-acyltransferase [Candidatus Acidoferrales bacterium]|nr:UDP-3-O-(3-hydroxymyristoyl)glucosamine N-acyltransferase [Candidatus Acidoferrales bacterium]